MHFHDIAARRGSNKSGANVLVILVERTDITWVLVVVQHLRHSAARVIQDARVFDKFVEHELSILDLADTFDGYHRPDDRWRHLEGEMSGLEWDTHVAGGDRVAVPITHRIYKNTIDVPSELKGIMTEETYQKARLYGLDKSTFGIFKDIFSIIEATLLIVFYGLLYFWNISSVSLNKLGYTTYNEVLQSIMFVFIMNVFNTIISLPFSVYYTFVLEERHGFNKQVSANLEGLHAETTHAERWFTVISSKVVLGGVACFTLYQLYIYIYLHIIIQTLVLLLYINIYVRYLFNTNQSQKHSQEDYFTTWLFTPVGGDYFFIYLWVFAMVTTIFLMTIYPNVIAPLFDKYTPLSQGMLRARIEDLAQSISFPLTKLYVVEGSKRSTHSNAYFYGFFNNKRIVLFDTLLKDYVPEGKKKEEITEEEKTPSGEKKGCDDNEVLAVLGHELGHWKLNHVLKNIIIMQVNLFLTFLVFGLLFKYDALYKVVGFQKEKPVIIGMLVVLQFILSPYNAVLSFMLTILSRRFEFQADQFAMSLGKTHFLRRALVKLNQDNLGFPVYDWLYFLLASLSPSTPRASASPRRHQEEFEL
uniref:Ste24 endopeptidase n=1 Tax=Timema shepardi TaxID=629360 RepID=A0A7R9AKV7_TIMSH|nr:unnamed protein product [Timema shepardi]